MATRRLAALLVCLLAACHDRRPPPNVVLIVADTLRADKLGAYGSTRGLTPFLDSFANQAHVFQHAYSETPWTLPSVASLLTSRFASQHGVTTRASVLPDTEITLAEVLRERGYATGAFAANGLMRAQGGLGQGCDTFDVLWLTGDNQKVSGEMLNHVALAWLDGLARGAGTLPPVFLYLHYMEPHMPYTPPTAILDRVLAGRPRPDLAALNALTLVMPLQSNLDELLPALRDGYDAEVATLDQAVYALFIELTQRHFLDDTIVVFTADHGEEFKEHGRFGHGEALYDEVTHVPLVVRLPGDKTRTDVADVVSLIDVAPIVLDRVGIPAPAAFEGAPWRAHAPGTPPAVPRPAFIELIPVGANGPLPARAVVLGSHKLILRDDGDAETYDLDADPAERNPHGLADDTLLRQTLTSFRDRLARSGQQHVVEPLDDDAKARLRALGYTHD